MNGLVSAQSSVVIAGKTMAQQREKHSLSGIDHTVRFVALEIAFKKFAGDLGPDFLGQLTPFPRG